MHHRRRKSSALTLIAAILLLAACQQQTSDDPTPSISTPGHSAYLSKSEALAGKLQQALGAQLMAAMQAGGPLAAIRVCQDVAQDITRVTSQEVVDCSISRTALRVRNPANRAKQDSARVLENWQLQLQAGEPLEPTLHTDGTKVIVHRPIMTGDICLQCHGETGKIEMETLALLTQLYPEDQATGFSASSLRGAFRIEFKQ